MKQFNEIQLVGSQNILTKYLAFSENEDLTMYFFENKISINPSLISTISKNQYNNKIGCYQYSESDFIFIKIFVLPKTENISDINSVNDLLLIFEKYFFEYVRLKNLFGSLHGFSTIPDNIVDLDFSSIRSISEYFESRYSKVLREVISFFRKHSRVQYSTHLFSSQTVTAQINFKRNVLELNKSLLHQQENIINNKSLLASITYSVVSFFSLHKNHLLSNSTLADDIKLLNNILGKILKNNFVDLKKLSSSSKIEKALLSKVFKNDFSHNRLRDNLLILLGWETSNNNIKIKDFDSIWFSPEYMYELNVFEKLNKLKMDGVLDFYSKPSLPYNIISENRVLAESSSCPDFVIQYGNKKMILDAKWKIIYDFNSIQNEDLLKAFRDEEIHFPDSSDVNVILAYPRILIETINFETKIFCYNYNPRYTFEIMSIPLFSTDVVSSLFNPSIKNL